jgi:hypothetical protein
MAQSFQDTLDDVSYNPEGKSFHTKMTLVPDGTEAKATVCPEPRLIVFADKNNPGEHRAMMEYTFVINDQEVKEQLNLDEPKAVYLLGLDTVKGWDGVGKPPLAPPGPNRNVYLGRWLDAFRMNDGRTFDLMTSFAHEDCWVVIGRSNEDDRYARIARVGPTEDAVKPLRRGRTS